MKSRESRGRGSAPKSAITTARGSVHRRAPRRQGKRNQVKISRILIYGMFVIGVVATISWLACRPSDVTGSKGDEVPLSEKALRQRISHLNQAFINPCVRHTNPSNQQWLWVARHFCSRSKHLTTKATPRNTLTGASRLQGRAMPSRAMRSITALPVASGRLTQVMPMSTRPTHQWAWGAVLKENRPGD